jgi:hypothetical protein
MQYLRAPGGRSSVVRRFCGQTDGQTDERTDGRTDERTDERRTGGYAAAGSRIATHSTWCVIGNRSSARRLTER